MTDTEAFYYHLRFEPRDVAEWNRTHPVGTAVRLRRDSGDTIETVTRAEAFVSASGSPVVWLKGVAGYYHLGRVDDLEADHG